MSAPFPAHPQVLALLIAAPLRHSGTAPDGTLAHITGGVVDIQPAERPTDAARTITTRTTSYAPARSPRELTREGPFWPASIMRFPAPLSLLGNEMLVASLPHLIPFHLYTIISATEPVSCAWDVLGPSDDNGNSPVLAHAEQVIEPSLLEHAADPATGGIPGTGSAHPLMRPTFTHEGPHSIVLSLNGTEALRMPLLVWRAP